MLEVLVVDNMSAYKVALVKARAPLYLQSIGASQTGSCAIVLEHQRLCTYIEAAAWAGFRNMTVVQLKQLWKALPVTESDPQRMPATLGELVPALVRRCCPDLSDEEVQACWQRRTGQELTPIDSVLEQADNTEHCQDLLEPEEVGALQQEQQKKQKQLPSSSSAHQLAPQSTSRGSASSDTVALPRQVRVLTINWQNLSVEQLKPYWPEAQGSAMGREFKLAQRWKATYPNRKPS